MINTVIKIIEKLIANIDKYNIVCSTYKNKEIISFTSIGFIRYSVNDKRYLIQVYSKSIIFSEVDGNYINFDYPNEAAKCDVLKLLYMLEEICEEHLKSQMRMFANSFDDNEID